MPNKYRFLSRPWYRAVKQDLRVFYYLFPWRTAAILLVALAMASSLFFLAYNSWEDKEHPITLHRAVFAVINLTFFQVNYSELPQNPWMDIFTILVPLIGLPLFSLFGLRVLHVIRTFFLRNERGQDWQEALIQSSLKNHIVVVGLDRIGYRVADALAFDYQQPVVGINHTTSALVDSLLARGLPLILGAMENEEVLKKAGIRRARVVIICTNQDWVNLEILVRVRRLNPQARLILRLFDDELAEDIKHNFGVDTIISRSAVAALSFAYAAVGGKVVETFTLGGKPYVLAQLLVQPGILLAGQTVGQLSREKDITVVAHHHRGELHVDPPPHCQLTLGDNIFIFATMEQMLDVVDGGNGATGQRGTVIVCGLGHIGYRIVKNLLNLGCRVVALDAQPNRISARLKEQGVTLKFGDMRWDSLLTEAGIHQAIAIVTCTDDDMINLQIVLRARRLNPQLRVVMRIFDEELSQQLRHTFGINAAYSASALASPDFISAALNRITVRRVDIEGVSQVMVRLQVRMSALFDLPVIELSHEADIMVLLHARGDRVDIPPRPEARLRVGDEIVVLTSEAKLAELNRRNKTSHELMVEGYLRSA